MEVLSSRFHGVHGVHGVHLGTVLSRKIVRAARPGEVTAGLAAQGSQVAPCAICGTGKSFAFRSTREPLGESAPLRILTSTLPCLPIAAPIFLPFWPLRTPTARQGPPSRSFARLLPIFRPLQGTLAKRVSPRPSKLQRGQVPDLQTLISANAPALFSPCIFPSPNRPPFLIVASRSSRLHQQPGTPTIHPIPAKQPRSLPLWTLLKSRPSPGPLIFLCSWPRPITLPPNVLGLPHSEVNCHPIRPPPPG